MNHKNINDEPQQVSSNELKKLTGCLVDVISKIEGDIVEFGCYKGDTSVVIQKTIEDNHFNRTLWLYDSFEGLPEKTSEDSSTAGDQFSVGKLCATKREVIEKFKRKNLKLPKIKKAFFENLDSGNDLPEKIAFAFLDGDFYHSIKTSLRLIENHLIKNSIIIVHDYDNPELPGATLAVDEWLLSHKKCIIKRFETLAIITCDQ